MYWAIVSMAVVIMVTSLFFIVLTIKNQFFSDNSEKEGETTNHEIK